ncbi:hypothetical protein Leryth_011117 [Lithospermum erythrorhizon]|nr:hypothetical protein Leryth_011117 [Lithospermum erythrorhizon]
MATIMKHGLLVWSCCSHIPFKPQKLIKKSNLLVEGLVKNQLHHVVAPLLAIHIKEMLDIRKSSLAIIFTNVLILSTPLEALAETCETENSIFNTPLLLFVALVGATVGGLLARQRRGEMERLNERLRQINTAFRRQAKIESYAPALSNAPVGGRALESEVIVDQRKNELISRLRSGKNFLRNQDRASAFNEFKTAFELARDLKDPIEEKKAARGLGRSHRHFHLYYILVLLFVS